MLDYLSQHVQILNTLLNTAMVLIWIAYLHTFIVGHRRQARSVIHIDLGAAEGARSRCLVTNLSSNAIYVQGVAADLGRDGPTSRIVITERDEIDPDGVDDPMSRTNRGTLQPGQTVDIGSMNDLIQRARIRLDEEWSFKDIETMTITVVGISGQAERIVGAAKEFRIEHEQRGAFFAAKNILTSQIRPRQTRAEFNNLLRERKFQ